MSDRSRWLRAVGAGVGAGGAVALAGYFLEGPTLPVAVTAVGLLVLLGGMSYVFYLPD